MVRLSDETVAAFDDTELSGNIRLGTPDDYADRYLPEILARFSRSNPRVEVSVTCEPSPELIRQAKAGDVDLAIVTNCGEGNVEVIRREPLLWVVGAQHGTADVDVLPLALSKPPCMWRDEAIAALTGAGRKYRILYQSSNATAIAAAVQAGLAVTILAESALRRGMRVLGESDGLPKLPMCEIGIIRSSRRPEMAIVRALAEHIVSSLDNLSVPAAAE
jgi:DNA-binding transcriptional LysR family regulator